MKQVHIDTVHVLYKTCTCTLYVIYRRDFKIVPYMDTITHGCVITQFNSIWCLYFTNVIHNCIIYSTQRKYKLSVVWNIHFTTYLSEYLHWCYRTTCSWSIVELSEVNTHRGLCYNPNHINKNKKFKNLNFITVETFEIQILKNNFMYFRINSVLC